MGILSTVIFNIFPFFKTLHNKTACCLKLFIQEQFAYIIYCAVCSTTCHCKQPEISSSRHSDNIYLEKLSDRMKKYEPSDCNICEGPGMGGNAFHFLCQRSHTYLRHTLIVIPCVLPKRFLFCEPNPFSVS